MDFSSHSRRNGSLRMSWESLDSLYDFASTMLVSGSHPGRLDDVEITLTEIKAASSGIGMTKIDIENRGTFYALLAYFYDPRTASALPVFEDGWGEHGYLYFDAVPLR